MKLNELKPPKNSTRPKKRVGRGEGSGWGKTSGRGHKGQKARSGASIPAWFEGGQMPLVRRMPKRGPRRIAHNRVEYDVVNIKALNRFENGAVITPEVLRSAKIIHNKEVKVKILGDGVLEKQLTIRVHHFSKSAIEKIESMGGKAEVI
jgi:large subunit ribosomal protein L15